MEMRQWIKKGVLKKWRLVTMLLLFVFCISIHTKAQDPVYTIKNGKMYIKLSKKLPVEELTNFISRFDLWQLGLRSFIEKGYEDSVKIAGWIILKNNTDEIIISKELISSDNIKDPGRRIIFTDPNALDRGMTVYGFNRFQNKNPFFIRDSIVTFFLRNNLNAQKVILAGSFNNWNEEKLEMTKTDSGWIALVKLSPGKYWYKFIADGGWLVDPDNRITENDNEGNTNSVFYFTNTIFKLSDHADAKKVFVAGSFNNWKNEQLALNKTSNGWELPMYLGDGTHTYRYVVDGSWMIDPDNPVKFQNEFNDYNSAIIIGEPHLFRLNGHTDAQQVFLSGTFNNWKTTEQPMIKTATGWELPYVIGPGNHEYKFIVDGKPYPETGEAQFILNPNYTFRLKGFENAKTVFLTGDFNRWNENSLPMKNENGKWVFSVYLSPGKHLYKFIVDGKPISDPSNKLKENEDDDRDFNSVIWIQK